MKSGDSAFGGRAQRLSQIGELALIRRIQGGEAPGDSSGVKTGIGDDTAVLSLTPGAVLLATTDLVVEDIHFRRSWASPRDIGWKAMAVNLSDIAAMGGRPRWALVGLAVPDSTTIDDVDRMYSGMREAAAPHGVTIVGGDCSSSPQPWAIDVTMLGEHQGTPRLRSMAKIGDAVAVTGALGGSAAGLAILEAGQRGANIQYAVRARTIAAHLNPEARVREGAWLGRHAAVHAMMDLSDGLTTDLGHICRASGAGARIMVDRIPIDPATREVARALDRDALVWASTGGEDFELLLTCDADAADELREGLLRETGTLLTVIGSVEPSEAGLSYVDARGAAVTLPQGYGHFSG